MTEPAPKDQDQRLRELGVEKVVDERDLKYMLGTEGTEQEAVVCTLVTYRHPDILVEGDPPPDVQLHGLSSGSVRLPEVVGDRPLVLFFGSYT